MKAVIFSFPVSPLIHRLLNFFSFLIPSKHYLSLMLIVLPADATLFHNSPFIFTTPFSFIIRALFVIIEV